MTLKYKLIQRKNPQNSAATAKWYAIPVYNGVVDLDIIAGEIEKRSSLTVGDIKNVIENFLDILPHFMLLGFSVKIDGLGTFRISLSSEGGETESDVTGNKIRNVRILYKPDSDLRERVLNELQVEKTTVPDDGLEPDDGDEGDDDGPQVQ